MSWLTNLRPSDQDEYLKRMYGTPESRDDAQQAFLHGGYGLGIGAASQLTPAAAGGADPHSWKSWVPGIGSYLYEQGAGLLGILGAGAATFGNPDDPDTPTVKIPGVEEAAKLNQQSVAGAKDILPKYTPRSEAGKMGEDIGVGMGQGATAVAPETGLPKIVSVPLHIVAPPASTAPIGAAIGGTLSALEKPTDGDSAETTPAPTDKPIQVAKNETTNPFAPMVLNDATPTNPFAPMKEGAAPNPFAPMQMQGNQVQMPDGSLSPENDTGISYGKWGAGLAIGALAAWAAARGGPRTLNVISDFVRGQTRDIGEATQLLHPQPGTATTVVPQNVEMPLPNDAGGLTRRLATSEYNRNAVANAVVQSPLVSPNPGEAAARVAANEMINNPANAQRRMEGLFRTGTEEGTGHTFPSIVDYKNSAEGLSRDQQAAASQALWYKSELNLRDEKMRVGKGTNPDDPNYRVSYTDVPTTTMRQIVAQAEADPDVLSFMRGHQMVPSAIVDSMEARGMITPSEANYARTVRPDYMPTVTRDGNLISQWTPDVPATGSGYTTPPAPAWDAMIKHFDSTIKGAQHNDWVGSIIKYLEDAQRANPTAVGEIVTPRPVAGASRRSVTVNTPTGPKHYDINNTALFKNLTQSPAVMTRGTAISNALRKFYQNTTTGLPAAVFGHPFAFKNYLRDVTLIPAQAQKDLWRGELDRGLNVRLPYDPTFLIGSGTTLIKDASTVFAKHLADLLGNHGNPFAASMRGMVGDGKVDALVDWMRQRIELSKLAQREAMGVGAGGNRSLIEGTGLSYRDPTSSTVAPLLSRPNFGRISERIPLPNYIRDPLQTGVRGAAESVINLQSLAKELYGVISDAPHSYLHDVNVGNPKFTPRTLAAAVQEVTGNPGTRGTGALSSGYGGGVPYYNTSVQALGRSLASFRDNPLQSAATVGTVLGSYALAEHLSALISGPDHVRHLEEQTTNSAKARNAIIYHGPGTDPNDHTEIPVANEWMGLHPYVSGLTGHLVGSWTAHQNDDTVSRLIHTLADAFSSHVSTDVLKQQGIGTVAALPPATLSAPLNAVIAATTGQTVRDPLDTAVGNAISGKPLLSGMSSGGGIAHKTPGQEGSDGMLLRSDSGVLHALMTNLGAAVGAAYNMGTGWQARSKVDKNWAWSGLLEDWKQEWKDNTQWMNSVWRNNLSLSTFGSLEERTGQMWHNVAATTGMKADVRGEGFSGTGKNVVPLLTTGDSPVPKDPQMFALYEQTAKTAQMIEKAIMPQENQIRTQMDNTKSSPFMPAERRKIMNELSQKLYDITAQKHQMLLDLNSRLSAMTGGRHVDVGGKINWQGTVDQFHY